MANYPNLKILASGNITTQNLVPAGVATTNSAVEIDLQGLGGLSIQVTGTYTGALSLQVTVNGTTWVTAAGIPLIAIGTSNGYSATIASAAVGIFQANVAGFVKARISGLAAMTGTAAVTLNAIPGIGLVSLDAQLPAGSNTIGAVTGSGNFAVTMAASATGSPAKLEDAAHASGDAGSYVLAVRSDTPTSGAANNDYASFLTDSIGRIWTNNQYALAVAQGYSTVRVQNLTNTAQSIKASAGGIHGFMVVNPNEVPMYLKIYNIASGSVTVGTSSVSRVIPVPAADATNPGIIAFPRSDVQWYFGSTALSVAAVTSIADNSTTPRPTTDLYVEFDIV